MRRNLHGSWGQAGSSNAPRVSRAHYLYYHYQERKTEKALQALRDLSSPRALVIRDGQKKRIPGRDIVREDLLLLSEGDRIPADAVNSIEFGSRN